jgi:hypothetical protein
MTRALERICNREKVILCGTEFDVTKDFEELVERELADAAHREETARRPGNFSPSIAIYAEEMNQNTQRLAEHFNANYSEELQQQVFDVAGVGDRPRTATAVMMHEQLPTWELKRTEFIARYSAMLDQQMTWTSALNNTL